MTGSRTWAALPLVLLLAVLLATFGGLPACNGDDDNDDEEDDDATDDDTDDDTGDDDTGDDDTGDDDVDDDTDGGCQPITEPIPPNSDPFLPEFTSLADYVAIAPGDTLVALGQTIDYGTLKADSFQIEMPTSTPVGEHDLRWDDDPNGSDFLGVFIVGLTVQMTYDAAFAVYRGCMTIEETGGLGSNFRATFEQLYFTEAEIDLNSGQITITPPGAGAAAYIGAMTIECKIVEFSQNPGPGDLCLHM